MCAHKRGREIGNYIVATKGTFTVAESLLLLQLNPRKCAGCFCNFHLQFTLSKLDSRVDKSGLRRLLRVVTEGYQENESKIPALAHRGQNCDDNLCPSD